jgi:cytochrome oxidase assembly protein ShyY1
LAEGAQIVLDGKNTWTVDDKYQITVPEAVASNAIVRDSANKKELLLPVLLQTANSPANAELEYYLQW